MYGMHKTAKIDQQLPILLEYIRIMPKRDRGYIPQPIASAETIMYAIQEKFILRGRSQFDITPAGAIELERLAA